MLFVFFWFAFSFPSLGSGEILLFGGILVAIPLYVRFGNDKRVKLRVWDDRKLIFATDGIHFGENHFPVNEMETAAIYLESFNGFEYRELGPTINIQDVYVKAAGDKNNISFRHNGEVTDFTFCLTSYSQFCLFRAVINDWSAAGVNVVLRQAFEDNFIVGEMEHFNRSSH
ncbi:MAG TPA: hypothetical protein VK543_08250 [Puia sp.]|nr:hypothetical protein [Puia sp.]